MLKITGCGVAVAIVLGAFGAAAQAAPAVPGAETKATAGTGSNVEKAAYRRCWWRDGVRRCRWINDDYGYYDYDYPSYGYGPGANFYFGGRGHGHFRGGGHMGHHR